MGDGNFHRSAFMNEVLGRIRDIILFALMLTWLFDVRFTSQVFSFTDSVLASSAFSLVAIFVAFGAMVLFARMHSVMFSSVVWCKGLTATLCASSFLVGVCSLCLMPDNFVGLLVFSMGIGVCAGVFMAAALVFATYRLRGLRIHSVLVLMAAAFFISLVLVFVAAVVPFGFAALLVLCPVGILVTLFRSGMLQGSEKDCYAIRTPGVYKVPRVRALLFVSSFLVVYLPSMFPKTTQLAPAYFNTHIGGASYASLVALAFCCMIFVALAALTRHREIEPTHLVVALIVLLAAVFFSLPFMSSSSTPFSLMMPCAVVFVFLSCLLALSSFDRMEEKTRQTFLNACVSTAGTGGLLAALFAFVFLGPLYGSSFQDGLFVAVPAVLIIAFLILFIMQWKNCASMLGLGGRFAEELDTSVMENRCMAIGKDFALTKREQEVLALLAEGRNEPFIEQSLSVSRATVKTHISHIYQKTGVSSRQELIDLLHE